MRVRVRDMEFETVRECAAHFGIGQNAVYKAAERGRTDYIGLGANHADYRRFPPWFDFKPIVLASGTYHTYTAASLALGHHPSFVSRTLKRRGQAGGRAYLMELSRQMKEAA